MVLTMIRTNIVYSNGCDVTNHHTLYWHRCLGMYRRTGLAFSANAIQFLWTKMDGKWTQLYHNDQATIHSELIPNEIFKTIDKIPANFVVISTGKLDRSKIGFNNLSTIDVWKRNRIKSSNAVNKIKIKTNVNCIYFLLGYLISVILHRLRVHLPLSIVDMIIK